MLKKANFSKQLLKSQNLQKLRFSTSKKQFAKYQNDFQNVFKEGEKPIEEPKGKFSKLWKQYGFLAIGVHLSIYGLTLFSIYMGITEGYFKGKDAIDLIKTLHMEKFVDVDSLNPKTSGFALAWVLTKFTEPIRIPLTVLLTGLIGKGRRVKL